MSRSTAAAARLATFAARRVASAQSMGGAGTLRGERLLVAAGRTTPKTDLAAPTGAAAARAPPTTTPPVYGLELGAGAGGVAATSARLLSAGAPAEPVASLLAAASARPDSMTHLLDMGAVAAAAGASAQTVAALRAAACGRKFATGDVVLAIDLGALAAAARTTGKTVSAIDIAPLDAAACGQKLAANAVVFTLDLDSLAASAVIDVAALAAASGQNFDMNAVPLAFNLGALAAGGPAHAADGFGALAAAVAAGTPHAAKASDLGVLAAAAHGREHRAVSPASSPTADVGAAFARLLLAAGESSDVAPLVAAACGQKVATDAVVLAVDIDALAASSVIDFAALTAAAAAPHATTASSGQLAGVMLAAAAGSPAHASAVMDLGAVSGTTHASSAIDMAVLATAADGRQHRARSPVSCARTGTIFGRTRGGVRGIRMLCTSAASGGGSEPAMVAVLAATRAEFNNLRAEMLQHQLKTFKENARIWEEIHGLRVKTLATASRLVMSVYGVVGSVLVFIAWQADTVQVVDEQHGERYKTIQDLAASLAAFTKMVETMAAKQEQSYKAIAGVRDAVKANGEKTESLAAWVAGGEKRQKEREMELARQEKILADGEKRDQE